MQRNVSGSFWNLQSCFVKVSEGFFLIDFLFCFFMFVFFPFYLFMFFICPSFCISNCLRFFFYPWKVQICILWRQIYTSTKSKQVLLIEAKKNHKKNVESSIKTSLPFKEANLCLHKKQINISASHGSTIFFRAQKSSLFFLQNLEKTKKVKKKPI